MSAPDPRLVTAFRAATAEYPELPPFHPAVAYPEYVGPVAAEPNRAYEAVRECFRESGLDAERFGTPDWNPLAGLVRPGETVLLKPNLVKESHPRDPDGWRYVLTHGSVIRAVADYVALALGGSGRIIIADAPQTDSSFARVVEVLGLREVRDHFRGRGLEFDLYDLRQEEWEAEDGVIVRRTRLPGDPQGCVAFDLADRSEFVGHAGAGRYYGADYDSAQVNHHHTGGRHEYLIAGTAIHCDVLFSIPKLKTHKKAGITVSLKNLVGINGDKNWLPHHTEGTPEGGGDEHPNPRGLHRAERALVPLARQLSRRVPFIGGWMHRRARSVGRHVFGDTEEVVRSGNWFGNDTIWRMCLDLNKIAVYGRGDGTFAPDHPEERKRHFVLVDGIIAGEGRGPMNPDPVSAGLVLFGINPASVDATAAVVMGFDPELIPIVRQAFRCTSFPLADWSWQEVVVRSNVAAWNTTLGAIPDDSTFRFRAHFGWTGRCERRAG